MTNNPLSDLAVTYQPVDELKLYPRNPRTHSKHEIRQIANSIEAFGFTNPVLVDKNGTIVAGHGRVAAAHLLGIHKIPTIRLESLSPDQIRAYVVADNRLAEIAGWDKSILAIELQYLLTINDSFDVAITGFEIPEIDLILAGSEPKQDAANDMGEELTSPAVSRPGDLWQLDKHLVLRGQQRFHLFPSLRLDDRLLLTRVRFTSVGDPARVQLVVQELVESAPRVSLAPEYMPAR